MTVSIFLLVFIYVFLFLYSSLLSKGIHGKRFFWFSPIFICNVYYLVRHYPALIDSAVHYDTLRALISVVIAMMGMILSQLLVFRFGPKRYPFHSELSCVREQPVKLAIIIGMLCVLVVFLFLGRVPIFYLFKGLLGSGADLAMHEARRMNTLEHRAGDTVYFGQGYFKFIYLKIAPLFVSCLYVIRRLNKDKLKPVYFLMFLFLFFSIMNGQIWPMIDMLLFFSLVIIGYPYLFELQTVNLNVSRVFWMGIKILCLVLLLVFLLRYFQSLSGRHFDNFFLDTFRRIYSSDTTVLYNIFPDNAPYRLGSTWLNDMTGFLPGSVQSFSYEVHYLVHGGAWGFTLSPGLHASAYVNFGYIGVFLLFFLSYSIYEFFFSKLLKSSKIEYRLMSVVFGVSLAVSLTADFTSLISPIIYFICIAISMRLMSAFFGGRRKINLL